VRIGREKRCSELTLHNSQQNEGKKSKLQPTNIINFNVLRCAHRSGTGPTKQQKEERGKHRVSFKTGRARFVPHRASVHFPLCHENDRLARLQVGFHFGATGDEPPTEHVGASQHVLDSALVHLYQRKSISRKRVRECEHNLTVSVASTQVSSFVDIPHGSS